MVIRDVVLKLFGDNLREDSSGIGPQLMVAVGLDMAGGGGTVAGVPMRVAGMMSDWYGVWSW